MKTPAATMAATVKSVLNNKYIHVLDVAFFVKFTTPLGMENSTPSWDFLQTSPYPRSVKIHKTPLFRAVIHFSPNGR